MDGFERRKAIKMNNILEAALALYKKYGVQKVSIAEIAKKANVSQVTIYNYFDSKDNLTKQVIKYFVDQIWEEQKTLFDSNLPFEEKIKQIIFGKKTIAHEIGEKFYQDFMKDYTAGQSYAEEIYEKEGLPRFIQLFNEGKNSGFIDPNISDEAILIYLQMFKEFIQRGDIAGTLLPMTEDLTTLFFYGLAGKKEQ